MLPKPYILKFILHTPWFTHCDIGFHFAAATTSASSTSHTLHPAPNLHTLNSLSCVALNCAKKKKSRSKSCMSAKHRVRIRSMQDTYTQLLHALECSMLQCVAVCCSLYASAEEPEVPATRILWSIFAKLSGHSPLRLTCRKADL